VAFVSKMRPSLEKCLSQKYKNLYPERNREGNDKNKFTIQNKRLCTILILSCQHKCNFLTVVVILVDLISSGNVWYKCKLMRASAIKQKTVAWKMLFIGGCKLNHSFLMQYLYLRFDRWLHAAAALNLKKKSWNKHKHDKGERT
jgi:hypothetical protein